LKSNLKLYLEDDVYKFIIFTCQKGTIEGMEACKHFKIEV
jgi:hypothetical protein